MAEALIEGEPLELIREAFQGMQARRQADGWVSVTGRLDRVPGEALLRALRRAEAHLPRNIHSTREQHRAAALDEIARQFTTADDAAQHLEPAKFEAATLFDVAPSTSDIRNVNETSREPDEGGPQAPGVGR